MVLGGGLVAYSLYKNRKKKSLEDKFINMTDEEANKLLLDAAKGDQKKVDEIKDKVTDIFSRKSKTDNKQQDLNDPIFKVVEVDSKNNNILEVSDNYGKSLTQDQLKRFGL